MLINRLESKDDFNSFFKNIYKKGYSRILIETGLSFLNTLLKKNMLHDLFIFKSNKKLRKNGNNYVTTKYIKKNLGKLLTINLNGDNLSKKEF